MLGKNKPGCVPYSYATESGGKNCFRSHCTKHLLPALLGTFDVLGGEYAQQRSKFRSVHDEVEEPDLLTESQRRKAMGYDRFKMGTWFSYELEVEDIGKRGYWKGTKYGHGTAGYHVVSHWSWIEKTP
jgi:hypothetical protein